MKLSHESKLRLGVGIGAFVLIIGLVFGISRTLIHFEGPWDFGTATLDWPGRDSGNYSAQPQKLSSETFDADSFQSLDLDVTSSTVEIKHVSGGPVRVIESGRVAKGASSPSLAHGSAVAAVATSASGSAEVSFPWALTATDTGPT